MQNSKIGLVLEGGAMRGMFTCGVLDVFMENGIEFPTAVGVSAGATFGCNFKSKQIGRALRYNLRFSKDKRYGSFHSLFTTGDYYNAEFCYKTLPDELDVFDRKTLAENPMDFFMVVTDIETGLPEYKKLTDGGEVDLEYMRASASMPIFSNPVHINGRKYLDGGISDSIPLAFMMKNGFLKNVVILTQEREYRKKESKSSFLLKPFLKKYPKVLEKMKNRPSMYNFQKEFVFEQEQEGNVFVICPKEPLGISRIERSPQKLQETYDKGRKLALEILPALKKFMED